MLCVLSYLESFLCNVEKSNHFSSENQQLWSTIITLQQISWWTDDHFLFAHFSGLEGCMSNRCCTMMQLRLIFHSASLLVLTMSLYFSALYSTHRALTEVYKLKSHISNSPLTHQICSLIFFPCSSTVLILKSIPVRERKHISIYDWKRVTEMTAEMKAYKCWHWCKQREIDTQWEKRRQQQRIRKGQRKTFT